MNEDTEQNYSKRSMDILHGPLLKKILRLCMTVGILAVILVVFDKQL